MAVPEAEVLEYSEAEDRNRLTRGKIGPSYSTALVSWPWSSCGEEHSIDHWPNIGAVCYCPRCARGAKLPHAL